MKQFIDNEQVLESEQSFPKVFNCVFWIVTTLLTGLILAAVCLCGYCGKAVLVN